MKALLPNEEVGNKAGLRNKMIVKETENMIVQKRVENKRWKIKSVVTGITK